MNKLGNRAFILTCLTLGTAFAERLSDLFTTDWQFRKDADANLTIETVLEDAAAWQQVNLPHDWAISGPFAPQADGNSGKLPWRGVGWYSKRFSLTDAEAQKCVYFDFGGVMASPTVYVNGQKAGEWDYGYMSFRVDATPYCKRGENIIVVRADTRDHHSRWYPGAGIYRRVTRILCDPVHIAYQGTFITTPEIRPDQANISIESAITNRARQNATADILITVRNPAGKTVAEETLSTITVPPLSQTPIRTTLEVAKPQLWDLGKGHLYTATLRVKTRTTQDEETIRFGIRSFVFKPDDGFHLNGRRVQLNGVDLHADLGPLGMAFNRSAMRRQLEIMQDMGFNALRTSHNCPAPELLELCDEMGIFVWNECFDKWDGTSGRRNDQNLEAYIGRNLKQFALRDRNHPCVFVWSIGNEIASTRGEGSSPDGTSFARCTYFREMIRSVDTTRPVGIGCCHGQAIGNGDFADLDITGWNYRGQYANIKRAYPDKPVLYSESASTVSSYGYYAPTLPSNKTDYAIADLEVDAYDYNAAPWSDIPDKEFEHMERDTYCGGEFVWTGFDYLGEPFPYTQALALKDYPQEKLARSAYFGIVDLIGVPKDRFYLYRSHWNKTATTLHILPHWTWPDRVGKNVPVFVYTNGDSAELFLNGRSLGRRTKGRPQPKPANSKNAAAASAEKTAVQENPYYDICDTYRLRWMDVTYEPGELKAVAYKDGKRIGEQIMRTAEKAVAVKLTPEHNTVPADGESVVFVQVDVVDAHGTRDPRATNLIHFSLSGPGKIVAVGNGNARGLDAFTDISKHPLYFGKAAVVVRRNAGKSGKLVLTATADGLKPATVTLK